MPALIPNEDFSQQGYVAPSVYLRGDRYISNYNYYHSMQGCIDKYNYLAKQGGANTTPAGIRSFVNNQTPQTFGINCDFYVLQAGVWVLASYAWLKSNWGKSSFPPCVFSFISVEGSGMYWAILDRYYFSVSATAIKNFDPAKLSELDLFYREVQVMKYRYNTFVGFLNTLSQRQLNSVEQRIFNEGMLLITTLGNEMKTVRGLNIIYQSGGKIGNPVLLIIAIIAVLSAATAWTISSIVQEKERTKRINDAYDLNKWVVAKKVEIAQAVERGDISQQSANGINNTLDGAAALGNKIAESAAKDKTTLGNVAEILKWGAIGYIGYLFLSRKKQA